VKNQPLFLRRLALLVAACFAWSLILAPGVGAATCRVPLAPGHVRTLSPDEMRAISGCQMSTYGGPAAGGTFGWQASVNGTNTVNGNKLTRLPLVSWTARGGLPVAFTLSHNSQTSTNADLGQKWTSSYDIRLIGGGVQVAGPDGPGPWQYLTVVWGDDQAYYFTCLDSNTGIYAAPTGIHDALVQNIDGTCTLTRPDQTQYHFNANL
jgi:hypothetical protein